MSPSLSREVAHIGKSVVIKGELTASEDLVIEGQVEGKVELRDHLLTIGPNGKVKAQVFARTVVVEGEVRGNIMATERVDIRDAGSVEGDLSAPRVAIADGAHFRGSIDMQRGGADVKAPSASIKPAVPAPAPSPAIAPAPSPLLK
jgi:cytoskeletal protein CcmA (bactofilin family)